MSQTALAKRIGVSQALISMIEAKKVVASEEVVEGMARVLEYPKSFFYENYAYRNLPNSFYRKRSSAARGLLSQIQADLNIMRMRIGLLTRNVEIPPSRVPRVAITRSGLSPEDIARELRIAWHLRSGPIDNLTRVLEDNGVLVFLHDFKSDLVDGVSVYHDCDKIPPIIFLRKTMPADRYRWTLAHELGHMVLHDLEFVPTGQVEKEADRFAAELLMPEREIRGQFGSRVDLKKLASLKPHWRVSMRALLTKARSLGRLSENQTSYLWRQLNKIGREEPVTIEQEEPSLVSEIIQTHLEEIGYSPARLRKALHMSEEQFNQIFRAKGRGGLYAVG